MNPSREIVRIENVLENGRVFANVKRNDTAFYVNSEQSILLGPYNEGEKSALTIHPDSSVNARDLNVDNTVTADYVVSRMPYQSLETRDLISQQTSCSERLEVDKAMKCDAQATELKSKSFSVDSELGVLLSPQTQIVFTPFK